MTNVTLELLKNTASSTGSLHRYTRWLGLPSPCHHFQTCRPRRCHGNAAETTGRMHESVSLCQCLCCCAKAKRQTHRQTHRRPHRRRARKPPPPIHTPPAPPSHQDGGAADRYLWEFTGESRRWINGHPGGGGGVGGGGGGD